MKKWITTLLIVAVAPLSVLAQAAFTPNRTVTIVVPFPPGGGTDALARILGQKLGEALRQQVVIDNRAGSAGQLGLTLIKQAAPDGYTLGVISSGHVVNPVLYASIPYDTLKDFAGVSPLASLPSALVVAPSLGIRNVRDLVAAAKAKPGTFNYATAGVGSGAHISAEKFRMATGIDALHVPFRGSPESLTETMGGRTQFTWTPLSTASGLVKEGKLLALAVSTPKRVAAFPDVPTIAEAGFPKGEFNFWVGLLAPAGTPKEIVARLNDEINKALATPEIKERLAKLGAEPMEMNPAQFDTFLRDEYNLLGDVMRASGAKPQ